jgi:hypothetical protein
MKIGKPKYEAKSSSDGIAQIHARIRIEETLQLLASALQPDLHGLIWILSRPDPSYFVVGVGSSRNLLKFVFSQPRARTGHDPRLASKPLD